MTINFATVPYNAGLNPINYGTKPTRPETYQFPANYPNDEATNNALTDVGRKYGVFSRPELCTLFLLDKVLENQKKIMEKLGLDVMA